MRGSVMTERIAVTKPVAWMGATGGADGAERNRCEPGRHGGREAAGALPTIARVVSMAALREAQMIQDMVIAISLLVGLLVFLEIGYRCGRRRAVEGEAKGGGQISAVQGATLGLLGLLLGFSFAGATNRFLERQDLILREANAIGTAYLRADMLDEPYRGQLRGVLTTYTAHRIQVSEFLRQGLTPDMIATINRSHQDMWKAASEGCTQKPAVTMAVLPPVNEVIDLHASRVAAGKKHLPGLVLGLLIVCSSLSLGVIGYGGGLSRQRHSVLAAALAILVGASLWTTIDLDHPRAGLIRLSDQPLRDLEFAHGEGP